MLLGNMVGRIMGPHDVQVLTLGICEYGKDFLDMIKIKGL